MRLQHSQDPVPALAESDIDSNDEDSLPGSPDLESGGDTEVEHDMWDDHPVKQLDFEPGVKPLQLPQHPQEVTEEAPELGCSIDGKSRRLQVHYLCSHGETQMPLGVLLALNMQRIARK